VAAFSAENGFFYSFNAMIQKNKMWGDIRLAARLARFSIR
jgi:hypothetical protein